MKTAIANDDGDRNKKFDLKEYPFRSTPTGSVAVYHSTCLEFEYVENADDMVIFMMEHECKEMD